MGGGVEISKYLCSISALTNTDHFHEAENYVDKNVRMSEKETIYYDHCHYN